MVTKPDSTAREQGAARPHYEQMASLLERITDAFYALDPLWRYTYVNARAERYYGRSRDTLLGRSIWEVFPHLVASESYERYHRAVRENSPAEYEFLSPTTQRWVEIHAYPSPEGLSVFFRDIHERKVLEQSLREADRRKDEFLATLAHELRNPLGPIRHAAAVLHVHSMPLPEQKWASEVIDRQVQQMARLLDDLLDVSRITRNRLELRTASTPLADIVKSALELAQPLVESQRHRLSLSLPDEPLILQADAARLAQVFANLVNNAAKYTDPGGDIALAARREGDAVVVSVKDNGIGIAPAHLPVVFDMFSQAEPALQRAHGGLGIGLSLVRALVQMHGGTVTAHSDGVGRGSEFVVRLPLQAAATPRAAPEDACDAESPAGSRRILVVDDSSDSAESLALWLRLQQHEVRTAGDGPSALEEAQRFRPEIAVLDIGLPRMDGYELARRLRQQEWAGGMVLVAMTGWAQEHDRRLASEAGFDQHLTKPVAVESIARIIAAAGRRA
jgi:PAS domain S-box-containing protein